MASFILRQVEKGLVALMYRIKTTAHVGWGRCVEHGLGTVCGTWAGDGVWNMGWGQCASTS